MVKQLTRRAMAVMLHPFHQLGKLVAAAPPSETFRILCLHNVLQREHQVFDRLLRYIIASHGVITPSEAEARLSGVIGTDSGKVPYLLTLDDGLRNNAVLAHEILNRYEIKAIFFVCPGIMNLPTAMQRQWVSRQIFSSKRPVDSITEEMLSLSWAEAASLLKAGHTLGSHTLFHRRLSTLGAEDMETELSLSKGFLEARLGIEVAWFAFPWGDLESIDTLAFSIIARHYRFCCSTYGGGNSAQTHPLALRREGINLLAPFAYQKMVLAGSLDLLNGIWARRMARMAETVCGTLE